MAAPAAKKGDQVIAKDTHKVTSGSQVVLQQLEFQGTLDNGLSPDVLIMGQPAAIVGSTATNSPKHTATSGSFVTPPSNQATVTTGSSTVFINGKAAVRAGDKATTCDDLGVQSGGTVQATGTVFIGG